MSTMSGANIPKAVLASPSKEEHDDHKLNTLLSTKFYEILMNNAQQSVQDMNQNRIKYLRKELEYVKETEWKYEPIDKYIGQSSH